MPALAAEQQVWIQRIGGEESGEVLGSVMARDTSDGLVISPSISGLAAGAYGFHLHENGSCGLWTREVFKIARCLVACQPRRPDGPAAYYSPVLPVLGW